MNTTAKTTVPTATQEENSKNKVVCACCLGFFPVLYLVGSTIVSFFG